MRVDAAAVARLAARARLRLDEAACARLAVELSALVEGLAVLDGAEGIEGDPPGSVPRRADTPVAGDAALLRAAFPARDGALARLPRVLGEDG